MLTLWDMQKKKCKFERDDFVLTDLHVMVYLTFILGNPD